MKFPKYFLAIFSMLVILLSCHKDHDSHINSVLHTWEVKNFMSVESVTYPKIEGNRILIAFNQDGTYQLHLDVNHCLGTFRAGLNSQIEIGSSGCTKICCDSDFSVKLVEMLPQVISYFIDGKKLYLNVPEWGYVECDLAE